ncbi:putative N-acetyltransferase YhbS [Gramella sp. Hel_I_59]|uniref:GNAT family N-acetyltransferase n=1 Tax=Gramella sp. Hel_I_59 TaxID=1249978 RepID=UPI001150CD3E|nr:GNAT family N-acetyltransferase [Gramella sp. Hel_I_59]TQI69245.1 putative N-acetyltransferase YhbS [Gramella sp. Hel_I_59]
MIRRAENSDLQEIKKLTEACAEAMIEQGIYQWNEHYPSIEKLQADVETKELFKLVSNSEILGIIVLTPFMDKEYEPINWLSKTENNLYVHRLATHPDHWGSGLGQQLMDFAENLAREENYESVRLDTFSLNKRNHKFYEARGYQSLGNIYFPRQSEAPFYCYELLL